MKLRSMWMVTIILAGITVWAQTALPVAGAGAAPAGRGMPAPRGSRLSPMLQSKLAAAQSPAALRQRVADMQETVTKMHEVLKQMQAKAGASGSKDPVAKANVQMWQLMLDHLDKQLEELRLATLQREELEARRAALYRQADQKAAAAASQAVAQHGATSVPAPAAGASQPANPGTKQPAPPQTSDSGAPK